MAKKANKIKAAKNKLIFFLVLLLFVSPNLAAAAPNHGYPKIANMFLKWGISEEEAKELAKWDLVIIDMEAQVYSPDNLHKLRVYNPDIIILAYVTMQEIRQDASSLHGTLRKSLYSGISDRWWLRDPAGGKLSWWTDTWLLNVSEDCPTVNGQKWNEYLPKFMNDKVLSSGFWDGIFYDNTWNDITWLVQTESIDINNDARADTPSYLNNKWRVGTEKILQTTRYFDPNKFIIGNGGSSYRDIMNGSLLEHFPNTIDNSWRKTLNEYFTVNDNGRIPRLNIINSNTDNTGNREDYRKFRFGLTNTLLGDGYYSFDYGDEKHSQLWWYDEYEVFLNDPVSDFYNIENEKDNYIREGIWRRDFKEGVVFVNATDIPREIRLKEEFEKIHGTQDPEVNSGQIVSRLIINPRDGVILLRPIDKIRNSAFTNASFVKIFDKNGQVKRTGFFSYDGRFRGNNRILIQDIDADGSEEILVADNSKVSIYNSNGIKSVEFYPYGYNYNKGINIDAADLEGDGSIEIITGTRDGGGPQIRIFNKDGRLINPGFFAYGPEFRGGVNIAVGDLNGDGWQEIIAGAGVGGGPHIRVFNKNGKVINPGFFAYDSGFRGGVNVAVGDLNGDNIDEIIAGAGVGGGPQIRIFNRNGNILSEGFFAYPENTRGGVQVGASDLDGDGKDEILAFTTDPFTLTALLNK